MNWPKLLLHLSSLCFINSFFPSHTMILSFPPTLLHLGAAQKKKERALSFLFYQVFPLHDKWVNLKSNLIKVDHACFVISIRIYFAPFLLISCSLHINTQMLHHLSHAFHTSHYNRRWQTWQQYKMNYKVHSSGAVLNCQQKTTNWCLLIRPSVMREGFFGIMSIMRSEKHYQTIGTKKLCISEFKIKSKMYYRPFNCFCRCVPYQQLERKDLLVVTAGKSNLATHWEWT